MICGSHRFRRSMGCHRESQAAVTLRKSGGSAMQGSHKTYSCKSGGLSIIANGTCGELMACYQTLTPYATMNCTSMLRAVVCTSATRRLFREGTQSYLNTRFCLSLEPTTEGDASSRVVLPKMKLWVSFWLCDCRKGKNEFHFCFCDNLHI